MKKLLISLSLMTMLTIQGYSFAIIPNFNLQSVLYALNQTCEEEALDIGEMAAALDMNDDQIFFFMNAGYALCMGYTYEEIFEADNL